jgi:hypothetical protein
MELRRMIKNAGKGLAGLGLAWLLFSGDANAQAPPQYEPRYNLKILAGLIKNGQTGKETYERIIYRDNWEYRGRYIDRGKKGEIGLGDEIYITIKHCGQVKYASHDRNLLGPDFEYISDEDRIKYGEAESNLNKDPANEHEFSLEMNDREAYELIEHFREADEQNN